MSSHHRLQARSVRVDAEARDVPARRTKMNEWNETHRDSVERERVSVVVPTLISPDMGCTSSTSASVRRESVCVLASAGAWCP